MSDPVPHADPGPARGRGSHDAPRMDLGELPPVETIDRAIFLIEECRRICRDPGNDEAFLDAKHFLDRAHLLLLKDFECDLDLLNRVRHALRKPPLVA